MADCDPHLVNTTAVVALGVATEITGAVESATGLSLREVAALITLANWADGQSIDRLRAVLSMSQPGCARLVDRLVEQRLATRGTDRVDRRVTTVRITARGRRVVASARTARVEAVLSGKGVEFYDAAGDGTLYGVGPYLVGLHAGDTPAHELARPTGLSELQISATGTKTLVYASSVRNLCDDLR